MDTRPDLTELAERIEAHRVADGGYSATLNDQSGSAYDCFLALGAYQDLDQPMPEIDRFDQAVSKLVANDTQPRLTPIIAATATLCCELNQPVPQSLADDMLTCHQERGGFTVGPRVPVPDLLSTATALHALRCMGAGLSDIREPCLDFLDTLWSAEGGFCGSTIDKTIDCEYTYYGLLALGHLSA
jgi:hypothetical protein